MSIDLNELVCFNFYKGWREVKAFYQEFLGSDISPQNVYILELCDLKKQLTMQQLAKKMELDGSATSTLVSRMEKKSLLKRTHGKEDRRKVFVQLTKEGYDLKVSLQEKLRLLTMSITNDLQESDIKKLREIVGIISNNREKLNPR
jgi:DNA-binding MarR family transcriptional regulator